MRESKPQPELLAIVVCDAVYRDAATGKTTLLGLFSNINAQAIPVTHKQLFVFVSLTEGRGRIPAELRLVHRATDEQIISTKGVLDFPSPLAVVEMIFDLRDIVFKETGRYTFEFWCQGRLIGQRPLEVVLAKPRN